MSDVNATSAMDSSAGAIEGLETAKTSISTGTSQAQGNVRMEAGTSKREFGQNIGGDQAKPTTEAQAKKYLEGDALESFVKIKVDGQEMEMPVREVLRLQSLEKASQKRMQEASGFKKEVERYKQLEHLSTTNPELFLEKMYGDKFNEIAEARLAKRYEEMMMTPEQREMAELKRFKESTEKTQAEKAEAHKKAVQAKVESETRGAIDSEIADAWKESGLPADPYFMQMIAAKMLKASRQGKNLTAKDAARMVKADAQSLMSRMVAQSEPDRVPHLLGDEGIKKVQAWQVAEAKAKASQGFGQNGNRPESSASGKKTQLTESEWRKKYRG